MKQQYLMLAHTFDPAKHTISGWYLSEKLDGIRAYWDGGVSKGMEATAVPYSNTVKNYRLKDIEIATGLWSRTGKVIHAPDDWLSELPPIAMDGELYLGRNNFQTLTSIVSTKDGRRDSDWSDIVLKVFDSPPFITMFRPREITVRDYKFQVFGCHRIINQNYSCAQPHWTFETVNDWLRGQDLGKVAELHVQEKLPLYSSHRDTISELNWKTDTLLQSGAEGVMLRNPHSFWVTQRSKNLLKHKPWNDAEAVITGFTSGRETDKGSRLLGKIGALIVDYNGKRLELSGLTDVERLFWNKRMTEYATFHPGEDMPSDFRGLRFSIGETITFKYRELSDDSIPKEARYWRKR